MLSHWIWLALAALAVAAGLFAFGVITLTTNLFTAVGVGVLVVGLALLFQRRDSTVGLLVIAGGMGIWLGPMLVPDLTVGSLASFVGVGP